MGYTIPNLNAKEVATKEGVSTLNRWADAVTTQFSELASQTAKSNNTAIAVQKQVNNLPTTSLEIEVNGTPSSSQSVLNLENGGNPPIQITDLGNGNVSIAPPKWTPNQVSWLEDFTSTPGMSSTVTNIFGQAAFGQQGFYLNGFTSHTDSGIIAGGTFPFVGKVFWGNTSTVSASARLFPAWMFSNASLTTNPASHADWNTNPLPLFDYPGWQVSFIFMLSPTLNLALSTAQKSLYVGLFGVNPGFYNATNGTSRPDKFVGIRFDTSTSAPSINDSKFTLECVVNSITTNTATRNNTQGTTKVCSLAPTQGVIYRLDITSTVAGQVVLTLNQSTTDTLIATVPQDIINIGSNFGQIFTGGSSFQNQSRTGFLNVISFGAGSKVTFSGITTPTFTQLNGITLPIQTIGFNGTLYNIQVLQTTLTNEGSTLLSNASQISGFPAMYPGVWFGNDDTAAPTALTAQIEIDKIFFNWV